MTGDKIIFFLTVAILLLVFSIAYSFGETDGAERQERISKAEMKLVQSRAVQAAAECDHRRSERAETIRDYADVAYTLD